ncbi:transglycosylase domain-containing protein, partial [Ruminococcaceae bacterium OttesenSCG-928-O06]|nr:transglycosylase domain-containing protein [Ruminococcaceae bacterium OttesenSCG-928-O06]
FFVYTTRNDDLWLDLDTMPYRTETILYYTSADGTVHDYTVIPCTQHKEYVPGEEIPQMLRDAFVAVEDKDFYSHHGFSPSRTLFAVFNEAVYTLTGSYPGGVRQGASTIDQQLIKNLTRDDEDSNMAGYFRKLREICRAIRLDALYDKDEILNAYLNTISFTGNTAGVQAEAKKLFGKPVNQLSLAECASLACITRSPARYNPVTNPVNHIERRNYVLGLMLEQGYITAAQHDEAVATPLQLSYTGEVRAPEYTTSWFTDLVIDEVIREFTQQNGLSRQEAINLFYNGGLRIYTTVDPTLQAAMEAELAGGGAYPALWATVQKPLLDDAGNVRTDEAGNTLYGPETVTPQAAMVSLAYDGAVRAVVGGLGEKTVSRGLNRATAAARQPGSTIKPIAPYVTALEAGLIHWSSPFLDDPVGTVTNAQGEEVDWPANASGGYSGRDVLVRDGLSRSLNTTAVRVGQLAGQRRMYNFLTKDLNFSTLVPQDNSLAPLTLGALTYGATPLEMAAAYAMFGNGGYSVTPHSFTHITGGTGLVMLEQDAPMERVITEETAFVMNRLLCEVVQNGTAAGMAVPGDMESAGKTGTTTNRRDHWFVGLTPYYVTASWYGYDEQLPLEVPGTGHPPTLAWRSVMQRAQASLPQLSFPVAEKAQQHQYCTQSGAMAGPSCPAATGWYQPGNLPQKTCPLHS